MHIPAPLPNLSHSIAEFGTGRAGRNALQEDDGPGGAIADHGFTAVCQERRAPGASRTNCVGSGARAPPHRAASSPRARSSMRARACAHVRARSAAQCRPRFATAGKPSEQTCLCSGEYGPNNLEIVDDVMIPRSLPAGEYVLGWRYDTESTSQVWSNCADVIIAKA